MLGAETSQGYPEVSTRATALLQPGFAGACNGEHIWLDAKHLTDSIIKSHCSVIACMLLKLVVLLSCKTNWIVFKR